MNKPQDWKQQVYTGPQFPGFRVAVSKSPTTHFLGGMIESVNCPSCSTVLFSAIDFDWSDPRLNSLFDWPLDRLRVLVCPNCTMIYDPYWITYSADGLFVYTAQEDVQNSDVARRSNTPARYQNVELPYPQVFASLEPLVPDDYPSNTERWESLGSRARPPHVYHQIGGVQIMRGYTSLACFHCKRNMQFAGIVDTDESHFRFREGSYEVALLFGDLGQLEFFLCTQCKTIGVSFSLG